jgi:hypothetical protein
VQVALGVPFDAWDRSPMQVFQPLSLAFTFWYGTAPIAATQLSISVVRSGPSKTVILPPPDPTEPTRVAAILAGEPSVVQKIVGGLDQIPVAVTVMLCPGSTLPASGLNEIPGAESLCAAAYRDTARNNTEIRSNLFINLCPIHLVASRQGTIAMFTFIVRPPGSTRFRQRFLQTKHVQNFEQQSEQRVLKSNR